MPFVCSLAVAVATRGRGGKADRTSSRYSTPVLILNDGRVLSDSTDIVRFAAEGDDSLFPSSEVSELVDHYGDQLGPYTRLLAYWHLGRHPGMIERLAADNVGRRQAKVFQRLAPLMQSQLTRALGLTEAGRDRAMARLREELDAAGSRLGGPRLSLRRSIHGGRPHLRSAPRTRAVHHTRRGIRRHSPELASLDDEAQALISEVRAPQSRPVRPSNLRRRAASLDRRCRVSERQLRASQPIGPIRGANCVVLEVMSSCSQRRQGL